MTQLPCSKTPILAGYRLFRLQDLVRVYTQQLSTIGASVPPKPPSGATASPQPKTRDGFTACRLRLDRFASSQIRIATDGQLVNQFWC
jgi:hypothetical protein